MDFLAGYASDSEGEDGSPTPSAVATSTANTGQVIANTTSAARPMGLFGTLPAPRDAAPQDMAAHSRHQQSSSMQSSLPAGFFDNPADADTAAAPSGVPAGFFDAPSIAATASTLADAAEQLSPGSSRPAAAPSVDISQPNDTELWNKLPAPKTSAQAKRKVLFRPQINMELLAGSDSDDDDGPAAKKAKPAAGATGKPSMLSFLPAPKNQTSAPKVFASSTRLQSDSLAQKQAADQTQQNADAAAYPAEASLGNEAYRLVNPSSTQHFQQQHQQQTYEYYSYDTSHSTAEAAQASAATAYTGDAANIPPEEAFLQEALQAEASKAARRAAGGGSAQLVLPDIQFKEVNADKIKYVDPAQREASQGMRAALGSDYAAKLRAQAAPHMGSKLARSKHQIGTLFANAKLRELEVLEQRAAGMKSKSETAGKYGWK